MSRFVVGFQGRSIRGGITKMGRGIDKWEGGGDKAS